MQSDSFNTHSNLALSTELKFWFLKKMKKYIMSNFKSYKLYDKQFEKTFRELKNQSISWPLQFPVSLHEDIPIAKEGKVHCIV